MPDGSLLSGRLRDLARGSSPPPAPEEAVEHCDLCSEALPPGHRHLVDLESRRVLCACRACSILFDQRAAGGGHYRLLPTEVRRVHDLRLDDPLWDRFSIPVETVFFFHSTRAARVVAAYPSPAGATESLLALDDWAELETANPVVTSLEPDVEALLVHRSGGERQGWLVPLDLCYQLVGIIRTSWRGFSGGEEVWDKIGRFFDDLRERATVVDRDGRPVTAAVANEEETWQRT